MSEFSTSISFHYITNHIREYYWKRIRLPIFLLIILTALWFIFPIGKMFFPKEIATDISQEKLEKLRSDSVEITLKNLYFTGYTANVFSRSSGYYYYTIMNDKCLVVLLSPYTCQEGISSIDELTIHAVVKGNDKSYEQLLFNLSSDLNWTADGLSKQVMDVYLDQPAVTGVSTVVFYLIFFGCYGYTLIYILTSIVYALFPLTSPPVRQLGKFGNARTLLHKAERELATLPQLATEDMFITEHFFIEISPLGVAIVPIEEIIWIYKHSTLHKFLSYHFVISYTLHIVGNKHFYMQCPKNIKSDIDGIMDYLSEANHNILVGFNEENRLKVQDIQQRKPHFEKVFAFLRKRI